MRVRLSEANTGYLVLAYTGFGLRPNDAIEIEYLKL